MSQCFKCDINLRGCCIKHDQRSTEHFVICKAIIKKWVWLKMTCVAKWCLRCWSLKDTLLRGFISTTPFRRLKSTALLHQNKLSKAATKRDFEGIWESVIWWRQQMIKQTSGSGPVLDAGFWGNDSEYALCFIPELCTQTISRQL